MKVLAIVLLFAIIAAAYAVPWGGYGYGYGAKVVGPGFGIYKSYAYPAYGGYGGWGGRYGGGYYGGGYYGGKGLYW